MEANRVRDATVAKSEILVILDTSFLLTVLRDRLELEGEIRLIMTGPVTLATLDVVRLELERLARTLTKTGGLARLALNELHKRRILLIATVAGPREVDAAIIAEALSEKRRVAVATVDRGLRDVLGRLGVSTIYPRLRRGLTFSPGRSSSP